MKINIFYSMLFLFIILTSCEKQSDKIMVTYRVVNYEDGFTVHYKYKSDTLIKKTINGAYTQSASWSYSFTGKPGEIVYISILDTIENSYSRIQILLDEKIYKEKSRTDDRFMPIVTSGIIPIQ
jgi:hypothetical protein